MRQTVNKLKLSVTDAAKICSMLSNQLFDVGSCGCPDISIDNKHIFFILNKDGESKSEIVIKDFGTILIFSRVSCIDLIHNLLLNNVVEFDFGNCIFIIGIDKLSTGTFLEEDI